MVCSLLQLFNCVDLKCPETEMFFQFHWFSMRNRDGRDTEVALGKKNFGRRKGIILKKKKKKNPQPVGSPMPLGL